MIDSAEKKAGKMLVLLLLKERHPAPMRHEELRAQFAALLAEHGNVFAALESVKRRQRQ